MRFDAVYFDGITSRRRPVSVEADAGMLRVAGEDVALEVPLAQVRVSAPVAGARHLLDLPGGGQLQAPAETPIEPLFPHRGRRALRGAEARWGPSLAAVAFIALVVAFAVKIAIPRGAELVAARFPEAAARRMGEETLRVLDAVYCQESGLDAARQQALRDGPMKRLVHGLPRWGEYNLELRSCKNIGANALALPDATLVLTDDLVALARDDNEIAAVLAHEIGHVVHRHPLRLALQAAGVALLAAGIMSDAMAISGLAVALPAALLESGYSRAFEDEADAYALQRLREVGIPRAHMGDILERLEEEHSRRMSEQGEAFDYLSSHPSTRARVERARSAP
jgi:hypothetical protein